jgi:hypothetical protein
MHLNKSWYSHCHRVRLGVAQFLESQAHLLAMIILRFTQVNMPLPPLKPMDQLRFGVKQMLEESKCI